jgi:hypothetical protein
MDEARAVLARIERIEALDADEAAPEALLAELRALLAEAEAWVRAEPDGTDRAADAIERCRAALTADRRT